MQPEAENFQRECTKNLKVGRDGKMSEETIIKFMDCDNKSTRMNLLSASSHAIMLPLFASPRKCNETKLSRGSYRICAALLENKTDGLKIEYEEDVDYGGNLYAYRARFYMALFGDQYHITDCKVQLVDAFSFNPRKPEKLLPFVRKTLERCDVFPASAAEEMQQIREGLTR